MQPADSDSSSSSEEVVRGLQRGSVLLATEWRLLLLLRRPPPAHLACQWPRSALSIIAHPDYIAKASLSLQCYSLTLYLLVCASICAYLLPMVQGSSHSCRRQNRRIPAHQQQQPDSSLSFDRRPPPLPPPPLPLLKQSAEPLLSLSLPLSPPLPFSLCPV